MFRTLSLFLYRIASWKTLLVGLAITLPFPLYVFKIFWKQIEALAGKPVGSIDALWFNFSPRKVLDLVAAYGPEGRARYAQLEVSVDGAFPILYTFFLCMLLSLLFQRARAPFPTVNALPVAVMGFDFLENACILTLLDTVEPARTVAVLCVVFTNLKWLSAIAIGLIVLYGLARRLWDRTQPVSLPEHTDALLRTLLNEGERVVEALQADMIQARQKVLKKEEALRESLKKEKDQQQHLQAALQVTSLPNNLQKDLQESLEKEKALQKEAAALQKDLQKYPSDGTIKVSDVTDPTGAYQYVNLVQEGGGVLGIALLGYTYVLERMGIRFLKQAGTSAGAITTMTMAAVRPKSIGTMKTPIVLYYLVKKDLFDLVDGHPIARWLIRRVIGQPPKPEAHSSGDPIDEEIPPAPYPTPKTIGYLTRVFNSVKFLLVWGLVLLFFGTLLLWEHPKGILTLSVWAVVAYGFVIVMYLLQERDDRQTQPPSQQPYSMATFLSRDSPLFLVLALLPLGLALALSYYREWVLHDLPRQSPFFGHHTEFHLLAFLEIGPLVMLMGYALVLAFNEKYHRDFQLCIALALAFIVAVGVLNRGVFTDFQGYTIVGSRLETPLAPYQMLSVGGISLLLILVLFVGSVAVFAVAKFTRSRFGINPGKDFRTWIARLLADGRIETPIEVSIGTKTRSLTIHHPQKNAICSLRDLEEKLSQIPPLKYDPKGPDDPNDDNDPNKTARGQNIDDLKTYNESSPMVTLITSEIVTQNKIEFPRMWNLFWKDKSEVCPADFVRASMSIPVFFEAFTIPNIPRRRETNLNWMTYLRYNGSLPQDAVFMDGGTLSNFPINLFQEPKIKVPRLPTFGIRLRDADDPDSNVADSLGGLIGSMFNTTRYYYDKDFLIKNPAYELCIGEIDVRQFNWLDFGMSDEDKIKLFRKGAQTAAKFLRNFDWELYKKEQFLQKTGASPAVIKADRAVYQAQQYRQNLSKPEPPSTPPVGP